MTNSVGLSSFGSLLWAQLYTKLPNISTGERLLLTLQEEAPGLLSILEKAMEARQRRGQFPQEY